MSAGYPPWASAHILRDRPFKFQGGLWFFVSFRIFFRTTQELEFFFLSRKAWIFFPDFNIRLYDKDSESDYFFFLHQNQNIFFSNIGNENIFLEKNHNPPLQVKWSFPNCSFYWYSWNCWPSVFKVFFIISIYAKQWPCNRYNRSPCCSSF